MHRSLTTFLSHGLGLSALLLGCGPSAHSGSAGVAFDAAAEQPFTSTQLDAGARALVLDAQLGPDPRAAGDAARAEGSADGASADLTVSRSCYGRCGLPELLVSEPGCSCDLDCVSRADCCADKHELCAVSARAPLCTLTGLALDSALCGTDLGWSFAHAGRVEVLFGDSYDATCTDPYPYDDAQGTLPHARPDALPTQLLSAPATPPSACRALLALDKQSSGGSFAPMRLFEDGKALSSWLGETPLTGFSDGEHAYVISRRGSSIADPLYVAVRDPSAAPDIAPARSVYRVGQRYVSSHFQNLTAATVARFDPAEPEAHDYGPGGGALFLFGRADFAGESSRSVYLSEQKLPLLESGGRFVWSPSYFAGLDAGQPRWSAREADAVPVLADDVERPQQFDVTWVPALGKWLMLYGGDVADWLDSTPNDQPRHGAIHMRMAEHPWGPWSRATPVFWREHAAAFLHCDAPPRPSGGAAVGCDLDELPADPQHSYSPGTWAPQSLDFPGCIDGELKPRQPNFAAGGVVPCLGAQRGNLYAPSIIDSWTADLSGDHGYAHAATLYFTVSTWMPYQVILASLLVHLP
ncbi:MAG: hypothetical protein JWN48_117 [Myxococcaceae bacterium]|nr:hypothetical protein [Myxococcaceae bacterium]